MRNLAFNDFTGGMVTDPRDSRINVSRLCKGFDAYTYPYKLVPQRSMINADNSAAANEVVNFAYYASVLYGLGLANPTAGVQIFKRTALPGTSWLTPANNTSTAGTPDQNVFIYYHTKIYGLFKGSQIWAFDTTGGSFNNSVQGLGYTNTAPALVHSKDDILYIPTDNQISTYNFGTTTWSTGILVLPSNFVISNICEYGNYLAIGCYDSGSGRSKVFLWDRDSSLTTLSEVIDWGAGQLTVLEQVEGTLIGISVEHTVVSGPERLVFRYYGGSGTSSNNSTAGPGAIKFNELLSDATDLILLPQCKLVTNNRLYFMASMIMEGVLNEGVWSIFQNNAGGWSVNVDRKPNNDTQTISGLMVNFFIYSDVMFIAYISNGVYALSATDSQANYNSTSYFETTINPLQPERYKLSAGMRTEKKQVIATRLCTELLTAGQIIVLNYRVDGGAWIPLITATADGLNVRESANQDANGNAITQGREYEFQITSYGGAQITEFVYKLDENNTLFDVA